MPRRSWLRGPLLGFDTETTGVDVARDRIVSAALVERDASGTRTRTWLLDPGVPIPAAAAGIHGITTETARAQGRPAPEALEEIAAGLAAALRRGVPVVAYNALFDLSLLDAELRRHGLATLHERLGRPVGPVLDPFVLDRAVDRYRRGKRRLVDLCRHYRVVEDGALHTADVDVVATLDVLARIARRFPRLARLDPAALHALQERSHRASVDRREAWLAERGAPAPDPAAARAARQWPLAVDAGRPAPGQRPV
nr:exonuclease domain-containing protein [Cellulomonas endophytica]